MRTVSIVLALAVLALAAAALLPEAADYQPYVSFATVAAAAVLVLSLLTGGSRRQAPAPAVAEVARPAPPPAANQAEAEIVAFLAGLQERGRLVDFLMEDVTAYPDAQVAAAARVVHQGCRAVLLEQFRITPVCSEAEGSTVTVPAGAAPDEYRLSGRIAGEPPFTGTLTHRGWKTEWVKLPRVLRHGGDRLPTIAPAEVELK